MGKGTEAEEWGADQRNFKGITKLLRGSVVSCLVQPSDPKDRPINDDHPSASAAAAGCKPRETTSDDLPSSLFWGETVALRCPCPPSLSAGAVER